MTYEELQEKEALTKRALHSWTLDLEYFKGQYLKALEVTRELENQLVEINSQLEKASK